MVIYFRKDRQKKYAGRKRKGMIEKIYFDMDGVLADFDRGIRELCGLEFSTVQGKRTEEEDNLMWEEIKKIDNFYDKLEPLPGSVEMFQKIYAKYGDKCEILTGIPKPRRGITTAGEDKIAWVRRLLSKDIKVNIVYRAEKKNYCKGENYILIDDLDKNILEWKECGGTGILHTDAAKTTQMVFCF